MIEIQLIHRENGKSDTHVMMLTSAEPSFRNLLAYNNEDDESHHTQLSLQGLTRLVRGKEEEDRFVLSFSRTLTIVE